MPTERAIQPVARAVPTHRPRSAIPVASNGPGTASARRRFAAAFCAGVFLAAFFTGFLAAFLAAFFAVGFRFADEVRLRAALRALPEVFAIMPHTVPPPRASARLPETYAGLG
ncbi:hypothetical protein GCM10027447_24400 [Glycomyces halotolerans]